MSVWGEGNIFFNQNNQQCLWREKQTRVITISVEPDVCFIHVKCPMSVMSVVLCSIWSHPHWHPRDSRTRSHSNPPPFFFFVFCFSLYSPIFFFFQSTFVSPPPEISVLPKLFSSWFFRSVFLQLYIHIYISITWLRIQSIQKSTNLEGFQCSFLMVLASMSWKQTRCTPNGLCFLLFLPWQSIRRDTFLFFNGRNYRKNISQWTTTKKGIKYLRFFLCIFYSYSLTDAIVIEKKKHYWNPPKCQCSRPPPPPKKNLCIQRLDGLPGASFFFF